MLEEDDLMINDLKVWPVPFDPSWNSLQHPL
jgi:hypothetical protein